MKLVKHKKLEEEFSLVNSKAEEQTTQNPIKLDVNGKWMNKKDKKNMILYIYNNKVGVVIYLNETAYNNMKVVNVIFKDSVYEFFSENELLFTYSDEKIMLNGVHYDRLSNEFSTDNIIKKTLADNDVFKNLNYMVSIDKDSKYIGKYNLVEDLTKYNAYKKSGDPLSLELEEIILNKVLLIKAIRDKKYKEAEEFSNKLNTLESKFRKKMIFNKFDSNRDGTIDINEIDNYVSKNYKLSKPGFVKIKTAIFDGANLIVRFDKEITTNDNSFKNVTTENEAGPGNDINLQNIFKLRINGEDKTSFIDNQVNKFIGSTLYNSSATSSERKSYFNIESANYPSFPSPHNIKLEAVPSHDDNTKVSGDTDTQYTLAVNNELQLTTSGDTKGDFTISRTVSETTQTKFKNYTNIRFRQKSNENKTVNINNPNIEILNKDSLKIKLKEDVIQQLNTSNNIKLYINTETYINVRPPNTSVTPNITNINRTLKKSLVKIHKTINNFEEFDNSIFGT